MPEDDRGRSPRRGGGPPRSGDQPKSDRGQSTRRRGRGGSEGGGGSWREQDLIEREARLQRSGGYLKKRRQEAKRRGEQQTERAQTPAQTGGPVRIVEPFTIKDLSAATGVKGAEIVKKLFLQGVMASINSGIDAEKAQEVMLDYDIELEVVEARSAEDVVAKQFEDREGVDVRPRGPVVTILGHVDHGKTSLLDRIRKANVAAGEAGGITQATSAFRVPVHVGDEEKQVVFIDTPGHEAFTEMRSRGATVTDIVVLVVAADDGVMPQTVESINHARAAEVPVVVAVNKIDKEGANTQKVRQELVTHGLQPEEWGGETMYVECSAITGQGVDKLLESILLASELLELDANIDIPAEGTVLESYVDRGRGPVANVLVRDGTLKTGDHVVAGGAWGRVRAMTDDRGKQVKEAGPATPIEVLGLNDIPKAGDFFYKVTDAKKAQEVAEAARAAGPQKSLSAARGLDDLYQMMQAGDVRELKLVVKADVQGSIEAIVKALTDVSTDQVKVNVIHTGVGGITENDVNLASASEAIIIGFNVRPAGQAAATAKKQNVDMRMYKIIYEAVDEVKAALAGLLAPKLVDKELGKAEVRQTFAIPKIGTIAGCYVTDGKLVRNAKVRLVRDSVMIWEGKLGSLKRFKDDAREVASGYECGLSLEGYNDVKERDVIECFETEEVAATLE
jgi:translation initiation factor IF-2